MYVPRHEPLTSPLPISRVDIPVRSIGYGAAAQLDRMLHGNAPEPFETGLQPLGVTSRQSTDLVAARPRRSAA